MSLHLLTTAGGNPTAIWIEAGALDAAACAERGPLVLSAAASMARLALGDGAPDPEQVGFVSLGERRLQMSGGELCGNATLAAGALIGRCLGQSALTIRASGAAAPIEVIRTRLDAARDQVSCGFTDLPATIQRRRLGGRPVAAVDMGSIVHVLIEGPVPEDPLDAHAQACAALGVPGDVAAGVCWYRETSDGLRLDPLVRSKVGGRDVYVFESACGSGSIALSALTGQRDILQRTGQRIAIQRSGGQTLVTAAVASALAADADRWPDDANPGELR